MGGTGLAEHTDQPSEQCTEEEDADVPTIVEGTCNHIGQIDDCHQGIAAGYNDRPGENTQKQGYHYILGNESKRNGENGRNKSPNSKTCHVDLSQIG